MEKPLFHGNLVDSTRILYTPSTFAKSNLIHLQEIGELQAKKSHTNQRKNLISCLFFIVEKGSGILEYNGIIHSLRAGDCVFLDCRKPYYHRTSDDLWELKWIHFYGPNMDRIYHKYTERGGKTCFRPIDLQPYRQIYTNLYALASSDDYVRDMKIFEGLAQLLTLLMEQSWPAEKHKYIDSKRQNLLEIKEYLDLHYQENITLDQLSELFFINKFYLTRIFKEQFGIPIKAYILQKRITHAKQLLRFSDKSIEEIGAECGMDDPNYFSRMFKKIEDVTPGAFRKMWQET